jgi:hypothetical protein
MPVAAAAAARPARCRSAALPLAAAVLPRRPRRGPGACALRAAQDHDQAAARAAAVLRARRHAARRPAAAAGAACCPEAGPRRPRPTALGQARAAAAAPAFSFHLLSRSLHGAAPQVGQPGARARRRERAVLLPACIPNAPFFPARTPRISSGRAPKPLGQHHFASKAPLLRPLALREGAGGAVGPEGPPALPAIAPGPLYELSLPIECAPHEALDVQHPGPSWDVSPVLPPARRRRRRPPPRLPRGPW